MKRGVVAGVAISVFILALFALPLQAATSKSELLKANLTSISEFEELEAPAPTVATPDWYKTKTVTYSVTSNGTVKGNLTEFATLANETLNDARGWSQLDARFVQVASGGSFTLVLAQASLVPSYSPTGCSADWSCSVGRNVIINDDRWVGASASWNSANGSLRDYRHMVVNHEVGHWLGHPHEYCSGAGKSAPVMQQQSMDLQGCKFNPWPLPSEIWSTRI
ncbi:MAG: DUF3152 domain-containing protein [Candidatus Microsaccharimonas sp.]